MRCAVSKFGCTVRQCLRTVLDLSHTGSVGIDPFFQLPCTFIKRIYSVDQIGNCIVELSHTVIELVYAVA